jgi:hypothetical protein
VDALHQPGNLAAGLSLMDYSFSSRFLDNRNRRLQRLFSLLKVLILNGCSNHFHNILYASFSGGVSRALSFILSRPFQG